MNTVSLLLRVMLHRSPSLLTQQISRSNPTAHGVCFDGNGELTGSERQQPAAEID